MQELREKLLAFDIQGAPDVCDRHPGPVADLVKAGLVRFGRPKDEVELALEDASAHELAILERGLVILATVAMVAPLLGFLGTVTGMINSFEALAAEGLNNAGAVASGISEALITTAAGLMIAIPVQTASNYLITRVGGTMRSMEARANAVLQALSAAKAARNGESPAPVFNNAS